MRSALEILVQGDQVDLRHAGVRLLAGGEKHRLGDVLDALAPWAQKLGVPLPD